MKITAMEYDSRRDRMVIVTNEREFVISFGDYCARKSIYEKGTVLEGELLEVTEYLEKKTLCREKALKTLSYSSKTANALVRVLTQAGFDGEIAKQTVLQLKKEGIIDEKDYCRRCAEIYIKKGYGPVRIRSELYKKGFSQRMTDYTLENDKTDFYAILKEKMQTKSGKIDYPSVYRYFCYRGYEGEMISRAYSEIFD